MRTSCDREEDGGSDGLRSWEVQNEVKILESEFDIDRTKLAIEESESEGDEDRIG